MRGMHAAQILFYERQFIFTLNRTDSPRRLAAPALCLKSYAWFFKLRSCGVITAATSRFAALYSVQPSLLPIRLLKLFRGHFRRAQTKLLRARRAENHSYSSPDHQTPYMCIDSAFHALSVPRRLQSSVLLPISVRQSHDWIYAFVTNQEYLWCAVFCLECFVELLQAWWWRPRSVICAQCSLVHGVSDQRTEVRALMGEQLIIHTIQ